MQMKMKSEAALTKAETVALWYAVDCMKAMVGVMHTIDDVTPDQVAAEKARLRTAQLALRKVNALRKATGRPARQAAAQPKSHRSA